MKYIKLLLTIVLLFTSFNAFSACSHLPYDSVALTNCLLKEAALRDHSASDIENSKVDTLDREGLYSVFSTK